MPLTFIRKAWAIDPTVDVVAADQLGRIHIFELKKASIGAQAASQLEHYLLRHVFQDADERIREWAEVGRKQVARGYLARLIMGAHACDRSSIAGLKKVLGELGETHPSAIGENGKRLSRVKWAKVDEVEKIRRLHPAVERFAIRKGIGMIPPVAEILAEADRQGTSLREQIDRYHVGVSADRRLVVWLVGKSIQPGAIEQLRLWRRAGVDARALRLDVRHVDGAWVIGRSAEVATERDALEQRVLAKASDRAAGSVRLRFHDEPTASSNLAKGGRLVAEPTVHWLP